MKLLLDTHTFIWWDSDPSKLTPQALALLQDPANVVLLSVVSAWEIQIKRQLGKLQLALPLAELIENQQKNGMSILPVNLEHVLAVEKLPLHHKDPFDRLLISQAQSENATLVSRDTEFSLYGIDVRW